MNKTLLILLAPFFLLAESATDIQISWAKQHNLFQKGYFKSNEERFIKLVEEGQSPKTLFIGCSDSRVVPELITDARPGDIFVIRNAGNFVPTNDGKIEWDGIAASIQYAIEVLNVKEIIVCGHSHCGAIDGVLAPNKVSSLNDVAKWIRFGEEARTILDEEQKDGFKVEDPNGFAGRVSVLVQLDHLLSYPFIKSRVEKGELFLHGWYFIIDKGQLEVWQDQGGFVPLNLKISN